MRYYEFKQTLTEDKITFIADQLGDKLLAAWERDRGNKPEFGTAEDIVRMLAKINHKAAQWLANRYVAGDFKLEDLPAIKTDLETFAKVSPQLPPEQKDLNKLSLRNLRLLIKPFKGKEVISNKEKERRYRDKLYTSGAIKPYYKDANMIVTIPTTEKASCYLGRGTAWCTAYTTAKNQFDHYNKQGPLYVIIFTGGKFKGRKFQFHFENKEFNDEDNEPIVDEWDYDEFNDPRDDQDLRRWAEPDDADYDAEYDEGMTWEGDAEPEGHYIYKVRDNEWTPSEEHGMQPTFLMNELIKEYPKLMKVFAKQAKANDVDELLPDQPDAAPDDPNDGPPWWAGR